MDIDHFDFEDCQVVLVSANDRYELNQKGQNREENDIDYFLQLFSSPEDRITGVYTADLSQSQFLSLLLILICLSRTIQAHYGLETTTADCS